MYHRIIYTVALFVVEIKLELYLIFNIVDKIILGIHL